jgi:hypothetical protein
MNSEQLAEMQAQLIDKCPDYAGIHVEHLGRFRVKVTAISPDRRVTTLNMGMDEEDVPGRWANKVAQQLHTEQVTS